MWEPTHQGGTGIPSELGTELGYSAPQPGLEELLGSDIRFKDNDNEFERFLNSLASGNTGSQPPKKKEDNDKLDYGNTTVDHCEI